MTCHSLRKYLSFKSTSSISGIKILPYLSFIDTKPNFPELALKKCFYTRVAEPNNTLALYAKTIAASHDNEAPDLFA
jgi:hypothetical protein